MKRSVERRSFLLRESDALSRRGQLQAEPPPGSLGAGCSDCSLAVNRWDSEILSTSSAMASTAASMRSSRPFIELSSRGGTGRGSSHFVISLTIGKPRTMVTTPGTTQENTVWTMRFGSGGI